jgi:hypothetical protein
LEFVLLRLFVVLVRCKLAETLRCSRQRKYREKIRTFRTQNHRKQIDKHREREREIEGNLEPLCVRERQTLHLCEMEDETVRETSENQKNKK